MGASRREHSPKLESLRLLYGAVQLKCDDLVRTASKTRSRHFARLCLGKGAAYRQSRHQYKAFGLSIRRTAMSKAQKSNKENKKPKADKNQSNANVSAYKAAQGQGKPASRPFAKKT